MATIPTWSDSDLNPQWLVDDDLGTLVLDSAHGYCVQSLDLGFPEARRSSAMRVGASGAVDRTRFHGARTVAMVVQVFEGTEVGHTTRRDALSRLRSFARAGREPILFYDEEKDGVVRRVRLAGDSAGGAFENPVTHNLTMQWVAPDGLIEAGDQVAVTVSAVPPATPGRTYPRTYPMTYPAFSDVGSQVATNAGTEPVAPVLQLWGPCTNPVVTNIETGARLVASNLTLTGDQFAEVDVREGTIRLNGRVAEPILASFDLLTSRAVWLAPGANRLTYTPASFGSGAHMDVLYHPAFV